MCRHQLTLYFLATLLTIEFSWGWMAQDHQAQTENRS